MLIVGAGGFAKEILSCISDESPETIRFFDDVNPSVLEVFGHYKVLKNEHEVKIYFQKHTREFTLGIGGPLPRKRLYDKFMSLGGQFTSVISPKTFIGKHDVQLGEGVNFLSGVNISNSVSIGKGSMVYYNTNITHDCKIGDFVEIAPGVQILGRVKLGDYTTIGAGAVILPDIIVGKYTTIGAGAVVTKNVKDGQTVLGVPAKPIVK